MSFFSKPRSPLGYYMANKTHDSYGVDHSNFSTRDELEYQWARIEKEQSLMEQEDTLGLSDNYTQYGTNFWGTDPENNYGFGYSSLKPETFQSALSIQKQAQLSSQLETPDILDANALTPDTLGEKQPSWLDDILVAQNQLQNGSFGGGLTNGSLNNGYLNNTYLNNNTFGLGENNYLNNNAFASNGTNGYLDNTYLNNNTFGLSENNYLNNNAFASNGTNSYLDNNVITTNGHDSLFAPLPLNQNSVRFADNPATNMATANNLDWGAIYKALFGVKSAVAGTLDGQGINNQASLKKNFTFDDIYHSKRSSDGKILYAGTDIHEGGFSNRINDDGGPTNYGITQASLNEYHAWNSPLKKGSNFPKKVQSLTSTQAKQIMDEMYYQRYQIDRLNNLKITKNIFDAEINQGTNAVEYLSQALNLLKGSNFSNRITISQGLADMINSLSEDESIKLNDLIVQKRMSGYFERVDARPQKNINNLKGWYNRLKTYHSDPNIFEKMYRQQVDDYLNNKYPHYYNKR